MGVETRRNVPHFALSKRILIVALVVIAAATLFPFRFNFGDRFPPDRSPFRLGDSDPLTWLDSVSNVLLFVPFGFGLSNRFGGRRRPWAASAILVLLGGAATSYLIEFLQLYIPGRNSGWADVQANSVGTLAGFLVFARWGGMALDYFREMETAAVAWLSLRRITVIFLVYLGLCFAGSILLQQRTRLSNWTDDCLLVVGGDAQGQPGGQGRILGLQFWDRAFPEAAAQELSAEGGVLAHDADVLASYEFSDSAPLEDQKGFLPTLFPMMDAAAAPDPKTAAPQGASFWSTKSPVAALTTRIRLTGQFTVRVVCAPTANEGDFANLVSLKPASNRINLQLWREGEDLGFWFRNPLSAGDAGLAWQVPRVFLDNQVQSILATYNGSDAFLYVDGKKVPESYHLGPGASLAREMHFIRTRELEGYAVVYSAVIFVPAGLLLGIAARKAAQKRAAWFLLIACALLPPVLLELLLAAVSGRGILLEQVGLALLLTFAGGVLINADRQFRADGSLVGGPGLR